MSNATKVMMAWTMEEAGSYRELVKEFHPDRKPGFDTTPIMDKLARLHSPKYVQVEGYTDWQLIEQEGDLAEVYLAKKLGDGHRVLKRARNKDENEFLQAELTAITKLTDKGSSWPTAVSHLCGSEMVDGRLSLTILYYERNRLVPLEYLPKESVDFRHVVWMMRRLLSAIGRAHDAGIVHGAVLPRHLLFNKEEHSLKLIDWCYSIPIGKRLGAIVAAEEHMYPPETRRKNRVGPEFDIWMAANGLKDVGIVPAKFRPWFEKALIGQQRSRFSDAWVAYDAFSKIATEVYGPPKFIPWVD